MAVLILGSKPDPTFPRRAESVVYANGAVMHSEALRERFGPIREVHVLSNSLLSDRNALCGETRALMMGARMDETFLISFRPESEVAHSLEEIDYEAKVLHRWSRPAKEKVTRDVLGPGMLRRVLGARYPMANKVTFLRHYVRTRELHVSTGVLALLVAIHQRMPGPYVIAGIGMEDSGYSYSARAALRGHQINDAAAFSALASGGSTGEVFTTEPELSRAVGLPLWSDES